MSPAVEVAGAIWCLVLAGMAAFFVGAARRLSGRGLEFLALTMGTVAIAELFSTAANTLQPGLLAFLFARGSLVVGILAVGLNLNFLLRYLEVAEFRPLLWLCYVFGSAASIANTALSVTQLGELSELKYPTQYFSPTESFSFVLLAILALSYLATIFIVFHAYGRGRRHAGVLLLSLLLLAPATIGDTAASLLSGHRWFISEGGAWLYCLVVLGTLLSEFQGAEGRLKETTSSLAERTAELEISYAEIDLISTELLSKQQLAAVGELAGSIAHEVRNPLAIIMNAVSALRRSHISETDKDTLLSIVNEEAERLNQLVAELLRFARPVAASRGPTSLLDICEKVQKEAPDGFEVRVLKNEETSLEPVLVDPGLFRLALDNLVANAAQSMGSEGVIDLRVRLGALSDASQAAVVDVRDTGCGMSPEEQENAVKPFFTTKPRGTGLGIPIAVRIVEAHGGELSIESESGKGTTVSIKLPFDSSSQRPSSYPGSKSPSTSRGRRSTSSLVFGSNVDEKQSL